MDRRTFLKSMGALAAAATSMPTFAAITVPNKYAESLRLLDACRGITDPKQVVAPAEQLFAYLRLNFPVPDNTEANYAACALLLHTPLDELESKARGIPPDIADALYPVALIRLGLTTYQIPIDPTSIVKGFEWFHKTYGAVILEGSDKTRNHNRRHEFKPKTAQEAQNDLLTKLNKETNWSSWEEDVKLYNIKGRA